MTGDPGRGDGSVPADPPRDHQHRPGWHARDIAVEKAGQ
jgi:hypothetical protein